MFYISNYVLRSTNYFNQQQKRLRKEKKKKLKKRKKYNIYLAINDLVKFIYCKMFPKSLLTFDK